MRAPFREQSQYRATTRLPRFGYAAPSNPAERPTIRVQDGVLEWLVGPAGLEPAAER